MRHQSLHDALTGLPNRALLFDRVEHAFGRAARFGFGVAVLLLDVDGFKTVNDSLGHQAGDELLIEVGSRLTEVVRTSDTVARLGGDEFVVLAEVESDEEAFEIAERIAQVWEQPFAVASGEVFCSASVGIAVGREAQAPAKMLREADAAMYRAKAGGRGRAEMFDEVMRRDAFERLRTESDLRRALERDEFRVLYQPIFDTATLRPIAVEALVRWQHPTRGVVGPVEFIPLAEETGLIAPLGRWVLEHAVAEVAGWRRALPRRPAARRRQRLRPAARAPGVPARGARGARGLRPAARAPRPRDHRVDPHQGVGLAALDARGPARDRGQGPHRRLRHRLLVAGAPEALPARRHQDRPLVRRRRRRRGRGHGDRRRHRRDRPLAGPAGRRRGRRGRGPARAPARAGLPRGAGLPVLRPAARRRLRGLPGRRGARHPEAAVAAL